MKFTIIYLNKRGFVTYFEGGNYIVDLFVVIDSTHVLSCLIKLSSSFRFNVFFEIFFRLLLVLRAFARPLKYQNTKVFKSTVPMSDH